MSTRKSPLYSALAILFSLVVLAGGAAKLYRGISNLKGEGLAPKVSELLEKSDDSVAEANRQSKEIVPAFEELLGAFDQLGVVAFRIEKREACAKLTERFALVSENLQEASKSLMEATKHGTDEKTTSFLVARAKSYELLVKANTKNMDIIRTTLDESMVDMNAIVEKVMSIAESREADQKAANEATAASDAILKQAKM